MSYNENEQSYDKLKNALSIVDDDGSLSRQFKKKSHFGNKYWGYKLSDWIFLIILSILQAIFVFEVSPRKRCIPAHEYNYIY